MDDGERADLAGDGLEVVEVDDGVAGFTGDEQHAARAGGQPGGAVHAVEGGALAARGVRGGLALVVQLQDLDALAQGPVAGAVVGDGEAVVDEGADGVLEAVDDDGVSTVCGGQLGEEAGLLVQTARQRALPDEEPLADQLLVLGPDQSGHGSGDLLGPVHRQVQDALALGDGHAERRVAQADPGEDHLVGDRGLADTGGADDHQALAGCPRGFPAGAPQRFLVRPGLGHEVPAVHHEAREAAVPGGQCALASLADLGIERAADLVRLGAGQQGLLDGPDARGVQFPQLRLTSHDGRVVVGVVRRWRRLGGEPDQVVHAAYTVQIAGAPKPVGDGYGGCRGSFEGEVEDRAPDGLVGGPVEVAGIEDGAGRTDGGRAQRHAGADDRPLGVQVVRRCPLREHRVVVVEDGVGRTGARRPVCRARRLGHGFPPAVHQALAGRTAVDRLDGWSHKGAFTALGALTPGAALVSGLARPILRA